MVTIEGAWSSPVDPVEVFVANVRTVMRDRDLTPEQLDALTRRPPGGMMAHTLSRKLPTLEELIRLAGALRVPLRSLIDMFDPEEFNDPERIACEYALLDASRRMDLRDVMIAVQMLRAFPEQGGDPPWAWEMGGGKRRGRKR